MTASDERKAPTKEVKKLRGRQGLTEARLISETPELINLPAVVAATSDHAPSTDRARAFIELTHRFLRRYQGDRNFRALASALNLDVSQPWAGEMVSLFEASLLTTRRTVFAKSEGYELDSGAKPISDWEYAAIPALLDELSTAPPVAAPPNASEPTPVVNEEAGDWQPTLARPSKIDPPSHASTWEPVFQPFLPTRVEEASRDDDAHAPALIDRDEQSLRRYSGRRLALLGAALCAILIAIAARDSTSPMTAVVQAADIESRLISLQEIQPTTGRLVEDLIVGDDGFGLAPLASGFGLVPGVFHGSCNSASVHSVDFDLDGQFSMFHTDLRLDPTSTATSAIYTVSFFVDDEPSARQRLEFAPPYAAMRSIKIDELSGATRFQIVSEAQQCSGQAAIVLLARSGFLPTS